MPKTDSAMSSGATPTLSVAHGRGDETITFRRFQRQALREASCCRCVVAPVEQCRPLAITSVQVSVVHAPKTDFLIVHIVHVLQSSSKQKDVFGLWHAKLLGISVQTTWQR